MCRIWTHESMPVPRMVLDRLPMEDTSCAFPSFAVLDALPRIELPRSG